MSTLKDQLLTPANRPALIRDCGRLIDEEVDKKGGLSGLLIKGAFKTVKAIKPGFIEHVIDGLLDDWVGKLQGHFDRWSEAGKQGTFGAFVAKDAGAVAEKLLEVTDARAHKVEHKTVATLYGKLRPNAKEHVIAAVPGLGRVVDRYL
jgi:hypothetical protein